MGASRRKSRKRSGAKSRQRPKFTFFIERNLGKHIIAKALREAGERVEVHDDHLAADAPDQDWIRLCGKRKWLAITQDKRIRYREWEKRAIIRHRARIFVLRSRRLTGPQMAEVIVKAANRIKKFSVKNNPPFIAGIDRQGIIKKYDL